MAIGVRSVQRDGWTWREREGNRGREKEQKDRDFYRQLRAKRRRRRRRGELGVESSWAVKREKQSDHLLRVWGLLSVTVSTLERPPPSSPFRNALQVKGSKVGRCLKGAASRPRGQISESSNCGTKEDNMASVQTRRWTGWHRPAAWSNQRHLLQAMTDRHVCPRWLQSAFRVLPTAPPQNKHNPLPFTFSI